MTNTPLVSIITPAYNEEHYISECIESVISQTYLNWEYIIVDNCSTDQTFAICQKYANNDKRIRLLRNTETVPVNRNHNIGFQNISKDSKYCKIVDADDWIYPNCLSKMITLCETETKIGFVGAYRFVGENLNPTGLPFPVTQTNGRDMCRKYFLLDHQYPFGTPSSTLYRSEIVRMRSEFYEEGEPSADADVCFDFLDRYDFGFVHEILSFSRVRSGSEMDRRKELDEFSLEFLRALKKYGSKYLNGEECRIITRDQLGEYYRIMGMHFWDGRDKDFWRYHRSRLATLGYRFSNTRLAVSAMRYGIDAGLRRLMAFSF